MYELLIQNSSFQRIFSMASYSFQKSALAVSASAALLALSLANTAQAANDVGQLIINAQISNTTCLLTYVNDGGATAANSKTLNLGTYSVAAASAVAVGGNIGANQRVNLALKAADGVTDCTFNAPTALWDVGINIPPANFETISGTTALRNTATANAATGVGVTLTSGNSAQGTLPSQTAVNFANATASYGTLLGTPGSTQPNVIPTNWIVLFAQMVRTAGAVGSGVYTHTIPLNVYYR
jgi:hypothetical protein